MALIRHFVFLVCGLLIFPAISFATDGPDSLNQSPSTGSNIGISKLKSLSFPKYTFGFNDQSAKPKKTWFKAMRYSGFARFYPYYRHLSKSWDIPAGNGLTVPVNLGIDDGYQQPLMLFRLEGNPSAKTYFQTELQFNHYLLRTPPNLLTTTSTVNSYGRYANQYVIFQFQGAVDTKLGHLKMIAGGGVNWYRMSPSTLWGYQYRDDMFERYPWEPEGHDFGRYNSFYSLGDIPRDQRFGMQATQGFILEGTNMPMGFDAALLYGKTSTSAFQSFLTKEPKNMFSSRVGKKIGDHKIGANYYSQFGYSDNKVEYKKIGRGLDTFYVEDNRTSQIVTTVDGRFEFRYFSLFSEVGGGSFLSNTYNLGLKDGAKPGFDNAAHYKRAWDEVAIFEITTKRPLTRIPLKLNLYRIGALIVTNTNSISNTSIEQAKPSVGTPDEYYTNYFDGMVTEVGQLASNRQGLNFFAFKDNKRLKVKFDMNISQEVQNLAGDLRNGARANFVAGANPDSLTKVPFTNSITFEHKLNGITRSRFDFYKRFTGPYHRLQQIFRRSFENLSITDVVVDYKKSFNTIDLELKYKFRFLGKELIVSNFNNFSSVQDHWSPIPVVNDKAFLRYSYNEFMTFFAIHPKITLVGFVGFERVLGNNRTELADANGNLITDASGRPIASPNGKPVNATGHGYGGGLDYNFHQRASLHWRNRWFDYKDKSFTLEDFKGYETTMELKVFF